MRSSLLQILLMQFYEVDRVLPDLSHVLFDPAEVVLSYVFSLLFPFLSHEAVGKDSPSSLFRP